MDPEREELEYLPWSTLAGRRHRPSPLAVAVVVLVLGAAVGAGMLLGSRDREPVPPVAAVTTSVTAPEAVPESERDDPPGPGLYTEADLMAVLPAEEQRLAAGLAEWFVADYFSTDDPGTGSVPILAALPAGAMVDLPHDDPAPERPVSYVEWARAMRVEPDGEGIYRVVVAFRSSMTESGAVLRRPVRAVAVAVGPDPTGALGVLDIPAPADLPPGGVFTAAPVAAAAPGPVRAAALAAVGGSAPRLVAEQLVGELWRVVVADDGGWPLAVWLDAAGGAATPAW